jgi:hypothetical protein
VRRQETAVALGLCGLMGTLPPRGAHLSGPSQLILRITEKKSGIQDIDIFTDQNLIILSCAWATGSGGLDGEPGAGSSWKIMLK